MKKLKGKKIAILAIDGFELSELIEPKKSFENEGAIVKIVSLEGGEIRGWIRRDWANYVKVDLTLTETKVEDFDALHLPGGLLNPDILRTKKEAVDFVKNFVQTNKPVSAICHAPWLLINAECVKGKTVTSYISLKKDLENAGATWVDEEVVVDGSLITSRKPSDLPIFIQKIIEVITNQ